jgi:hypothetical protein
VFFKHRLRIFDVEEIPTNGGSLRIHACHADEVSKPATERLQEALRQETIAGFDRIERHLSFSEHVRDIKCKFLSFVIDARQQGKSIAAYGAAAKGNTFLNYCGVGPGFIDYVVDRNPHKQGCYLPGTHLPIYSPEKIAETQPDYLLVLPWNIKTEVMHQMSHTRQWGGQFVTCIPELEIR